MTERFVLVLLGEGANDAVRGLMIEFGKAVASIGLTVVNVSLEQAELQYAVEEMARGNVRFALTWLGFGQALPIHAGSESQSVNCWEALRVPLVKIHADSPAYYSDRHRDLPANSANLYMAEEFAHFRRRWLPDARTIASVIPPWPIAPIERDGVNLATRRKGTLVFLKNGNSPEELRGRWKAELAPSITNLLNDMADGLLPIGLKPGVLHIGDYVGTCVEARGIDPETLASLVPFFTAQLDDYLRRVKSEMIANAVLDFPVIVRGASWGHVDFTRRKARLLPGQDFDTSNRIFADELGVIDMSPNMDCEPHERVMRAAGSFSLVLTNRQSWLSREFPGFEDMTFEFDPQSIKDRIAGVLADPDRYLDLGVAFGERFRAIHPREAFARQVVEVADLASLQCVEQKPNIQNYFVWPDPRLRA